MREPSLNPFALFWPVPVAVSINILLFSGLRWYLRRDDVDTLSLIIMVGWCFNLIAGVWLSLHLRRVLRMITMRTQKLS